MASESAFTLHSLARTVMMLTKSSATVRASVSGPLEEVITAQRELVRRRCRGAAFERTHPHEVLRARLDREPRELARGGAREVARRGGAQRIGLEHRVVEIDAIAVPVESDRELVRAVAGRDRERVTIEILIAVGDVGDRAGERVTRA